MSPTERALRDRVNEAVRDGHLRRAVGLYEQLERLEPGEPRWPHKKGDVLRRMHREPEAVLSYVRATDLYASQGFIARAVAMARVVLDVDPSRIDVLAQVDPAGARRLLRRARSSGAPGAPARATDAEHLVPASDAEHDELRFQDGISIDLDLSELEVHARDAHPDEDGAHRDRTAEELALLPGLPLFAGLPQEALHRIAGEADLVEMADGELLLRAGDEADALYALVEGGVRVRVPGLPEERSVALGEGDVVGEACLLDGTLRKADVVVTGHLTALRVPKTLLDRLVDNHPDVEHVLFDLLTRRIVSNLLASSPLFTPFDPATRTEIARLFEVRRAAEGFVLLEEGKRSDGLYILLAGEVLSLSGDHRRAHRPIAILGQRSLLGRAESEFTAQALTELLVLRLPSASFNELAATYPPVLAQLAELAAAEHDEPTALAEALA